MKIIFGLMLILILGTFFSCNFYEVDKNKLYRSAQINGAPLKKAIETLELKTIINLRGYNPGKDWYDDEVKISKEYNINHIDIAMSSDKLPSRNNLIKLLEAFRNSERPILVHCAGGADRTGEAVAIYQMIYMGMETEEAISALSKKYGHFSDKKPAKKYFIRNIWEGESWAYNEYYPCNSEYQYVDLSECPN